nr:MAG TPA: hypothetical protein [Caudoviricetes sp.]
MCCGLLERLYLFTLYALPLTLNNKSLRFELASQPSRLIPQ